MTKKLIYGKDIEDIYEDYIALLSVINLSTKKTTKKRKTIKVKEKKK